MWFSSTLCRDVICLHQKLIKKYTFTKVNSTLILRSIIQQSYPLKMSNTCSIVLLYLITCILTCTASDTPKVRVNSGIISGGYEYSYNGRKIYSFLGIPYASPPIQNYRFKEPQPVKPWLGIWNATIPGSACLGPDYESNFKIVGQEDCLYLNVYTPKLPQSTTPDDLMDVVVYIHGGAFMGGQGISYGPQYLLDNNDFVYVSINYRLGVLGFATTGDNILPANNGMKDQVAALKWIQQNIVVFGGNPNNVTITGMSAGASSVHYHMISPMSNGLFNRAILQSGSAFCHWSYTENVEQKTKYIANMLGCPTNNSVDIVECLRSRPGLAIAKSFIEFMPWLYNPFSPFGPTVELIGDEKFLPDIPEKLTPYDIPVLMSVTKDEGLIIAIYITHEDHINKLNNNWNEYLPHLLDYNYTIPNEKLRNKVSQDIKKFYFGDQTLSKETISNLVEMISDRMFGYAISKAAQHISAKNTAPVYFHEFGYSGNYSIIAKLDPKSHFRGSNVTHSDETMYLLNMNNLPVHDNEEDTNMMKTMVNIWSTFIKNGAPDIGSSKIWLPVSKNPTDPFRFIRITQQQTFEVEEQSNHRNYAFWSNLPLTEFNEVNVPEVIKTEL
ncbi:esterase E4-like isoform X2 [Melanaphis sacchari]|uniref:Carboxylic ester hydrolase n=1 Tax=Melanaphis sacchari TaxID=742174 RepID=A0A2H8TP70_9HEMI|nr:esterase E4-like isoform X2 [Melanaphis sacchari]